MSRPSRSGDAPFIAVCSLLLLAVAVVSQPGVAGAAGAPFGLAVSSLATATGGQADPAEPYQVAAAEQPAGGGATGTGGAAQPAPTGSTPAAMPLHQGSWEAGAYGAFSISGAAGPAIGTVIRAFWLIPRVGYTVLDVPWYPGSLQISLEPHAGLIVTPVKTYYLGIDLMARHTIRAWRYVSPYIEGGAGLIHTNLRTRALDGAIEFTPQIGVGFYVHVTDRLALNAGYRFHHISNAGTADQNLGVNSHFPYAGLTYFF